MRRNEHSKSRIVRTLIACFLAIPFVWTLVYGVMAFITLLTNM